ncbi:MAG: hypothetical protein K2R98_05470 [Gemmataceae bacterium]|nr:hypothetical protein [Gemmataceae bacterium]
MPATRRQRQPGSAWAAGGTWASGQTIESSSAVRVIEKNEPVLAQAGIAASGGQFGNGEGAVEQNQVQAVEVHFARSSDVLRVNQTGHDTSRVPRSHRIAFLHLASSAA